MTDLAASRSSAAFRLAVAHYLGQVRARKSVAIPSLLLPGVGTIFGRFLPPLVIAGILRTLVEDDAIGIGDLTRSVGLFALAWFAGEACWRLGVHFVIRTESQSIEALHRNGMEELLRRDIAFFHDNFAGSLTKRVISYANRFEDFFDTAAFAVAPNLVPFVFAVPVLWFYSPWLVVTLLGLIVLTAFAVWPLIQRRRKLVDEREEASAVVSGSIADTLGNIDAVRVFAAEDAEAKAHRRNVSSYAALMAKSWDYQNQRIDLVAGPLFCLTNVLGVFVAALVARGQGLAFEAVFVSFTYFSNCTQVIWEFNNIYRNVESSLTEAAQFTELLLDEPTVVDPAEPAALAPRDTAIEFDAVTFTHGRADDALFDGFDLTIAPGERIGLVGRSGGGKTTITHLLLRLMDIDGGAIRIGGQDIASVRQADLRSLIAYVPQDPVMFHRSLRDNIAFGRPDASEDEIRRAAAAAHATEFIDQLPNGFDTLVGERGVKLSGGQRQRIAIARAMLRDAPILLLDEATSALDSESEALIQPALLSLMEDRTAIVIAHRLSTVQRMDRLVVLDQGRIIEQGTHTQLIKAGGTYAALWGHQSGGFLLDEVA